MVKKMFVPVMSNGKPYKIFIEDIKKVHQIAKKRRPAPPAYNESYINSKKWEEVTDI